MPAMQVAAYRRLLARAGVPRLLAAATLGRLPFGMAGLAILLLVRDAGGSYATAGLAAGAYGLGLGATGPLLARLTHRRGPGPIVVPAVLAAAAVLAALPLVARIGPGLLVPFSLLAGACTPPLG